MDETKPSRDQSATPSDDRTVSIPLRDQNVSVPDRQAAAAANILRDKIDRIYDDAPPNQPSGVNTESPYDRTLADTVESMDLQGYHSAWQNYYQQYYQRYYVQQLHVQRQQQAAEKASKAAEQPELKNPEKDHKKEIITGSNPDHEPANKPPTQVQQFKTELQEKIRVRAEKARKSQHFMPVVSALAVGLLFLFLQYNRVMVAEVKAYISPGAASVENIIIDPTANANVGPNPRLIIPKINVDVPIVYGLRSLEDAPVQEALNGGVTHYPLPGANALPGQVGNNVILGHSSNDVFDGGDYKFAFVLLERLSPGDVYYIHHEGKRYIYRVTDKKIIMPNELGALQLTNGKPMSTLVTCTPLGTAQKRLLVIAEQVSPDPASASAAPQTQESSEPTNLPGNSPTFIERILNFFGS